MKRRFSLPQFKERNKAIAIDWLNGETYASIGRKNNLSSERIRQIVYVSMRWACLSGDNFYRDVRDIFYTDWRENKANLIKLIKRVE